MKTEKKVNPRERTLKDLREYMKSEIEKVREVVLLIDANEGAESRTDEMTEFIYEYGLTDTYLLKDPYQDMKTYARGKEKIDFILLTLRIQQSVMYSHIAPYNKSIVLYHRTLIVDID